MLTWLQLIESILNAILLLLHHPHVQVRAFQGIQSVVGLDKLPDLEDRRSLRYVDAIIQEVHRFNPAIPLVTRSNSEEDAYTGYRIPKETWIMANVWSIRTILQNHPSY